MKNLMKALALFLLVVSAVPAAAQSLTGVVTGTIKDEQGGALPGVAVTLTGKTGSKTTTTEQNGTYRFVGLEPGTYSVQTQMQGFTPRRQDNVVVSVGKDSLVDITLLRSWSGRFPSPRCPNYRWTTAMHRGLEGCHPRLRTCW